MKSDTQNFVPSTFVVDQDQYVHLRWCPLLSTLPVEAYRPAITDRVDGIVSTRQIKLADELITWIAKPDFKDGHYGPGVLLPCGTCVTVQAETERG